MDWLTDWPEGVKPGSVVYLEGETSPRTVLEATMGGRHAILRLTGIADRPAATQLIGRHLERTAPALPEGSYWWHELEGLQVVDSRGASLGIVEEVFRAGANEVYRVVGPSGERLIPALKAAITDIDLSERRMTISDEGEWLAEP